MGKWFLMLTFLNAGLLMVCFGLMAKQNHCSQHLVQTFDGTGRFALYVAGVAFVVCFLHFLAGVGYRFKAFWERTRPRRGRKGHAFHRGTDSPRVADRQIEVIDAVVTGLDK